MLGMLMIFTNPSQTEEWLVRDGMIWQKHNMSTALLVEFK
jgi:hypothetical protein